MTRYAVETLVNGEWKDRQVRDGNSYTYAEGADPATVRLEWLPAPSSTVLVVR